MVHERRAIDQRGYAMAALLVMVAVLTVLMSAAMPVWRRDAQREKEEELVFRGLQYVRAIRLYQAKMRTFPPSVDVLVQGRYLRKKYKDPITNDDFIPIGAASGAAGQIGLTQPGQAGVGQGGLGQTGVQGGVQGSQTGARPPQTATQGTQGGQRPPQPQQQQQRQSPVASSAFGPESGNVVGGIIGVVSKSKEESIRIYQGRTHYNEWQFVYVNAAPGGPGGVGGRGVPGGPGGQGFPGGPGGGRGRRGGGDGRGGPQTPFNPGGRTDRPVLRPGGPG